MPLYLTACDSCGIGLGALSVSTALWSAILAVAVMYAEVESGVNLFKFPLCER